MNEDQCREVMRSIERQLRAGVEDEDNGETRVGVACADESAQALASTANRLFETVQKSRSELEVTQRRLDEQVRASTEQHAVLQRELDERGRVHRELLRDRTVLQHVIDTVPYSIFWKDRDSVYVGANRKKVTSLGMKGVDELIGKTDFDTPVRKEDAARYRRTDGEVIASGTPRLNIEETQMRADGPHVLLTNKVPLRDEAGQITGVLGVYADITERKQIEEELAKARDAAEASAKARKEFLTLISHELRTPLTLILGPLETLLSDPGHELSPKVGLDLKRIRRNAVRLFSLVNDILEFTKLEAGKLDVNWSPVDIDEVVGAIVEDARAFAGSKGLHLDVTDHAPIGLMPLDERKFEKIALNLIGNALKFTPGGGSISVELRAYGEHVELQVNDTGPGIPADKQETIFRRFEQIGSSVSRGYGGTGIGLAMVKELTELMGGSVGVQSEEGRGSRFWARFPKNPDLLVNMQRAGRGPEFPRAAKFERFSELFDVLRTGPAEPAIGATADAKPLVVVADDSAEMRSYMSDILSDRYEVETVENGIQVLEACARREPAIIVSDIMMPEMDGLELVKRLKSDAVLRRIPAILVTARASREEVVGGLQVGADDYLSKPFGPAELCARVDAARRQREMSEELEQKNTALGRTVEELRATQNELIQAGKMAAVGTLVAGMSHELNNPIATILLHAQRILKKTSQDSPWRGSIEVIERQAERSGRLVKLLLDYSRRKPMTKERVPVQAMIDRVVELAKSQLGGADTKLTIECPERDAIEVDACTQEIELALLNLIKNAIDATEETRGSVRITAKRESSVGRDGVEISVRDTGVGIAPDVLPHIFDPFYTTKPVGMGTGLGLALTRKIVDAHGGRIGVESEPGHGTEIRVWLATAPAACA